MESNYNQLHVNVEFKQILFMQKFNSILRPKPHQQNNANLEITVHQTSMGELKAKLSIFMYTRHFFSNFSSFFNI